MDEDSDKPEIYDWRLDYPYDTVALNTEITVTWGSIARADFYATRWGYSHNHNGTYMEFDTLFWSSDTTFTIPASYLDYNGRVYFDIYAINGPTFEEAGNITGEIIKGRLISVADEYFTIYIGDGDAYPIDFIGPKEEVKHIDFKDLKF